MVKLVSKLNYPVRVKYGETTLKIPPFGVVEGLDEHKIEKVPRGIYIISVKGIVKTQEEVENKSG